MRQVYYFARCKYVCSVHKISYSFDAVQKMHVKFSRIYCTDVRIFY